MATILDKDLVRESTIKIGDREIQVTIGADQTISMKLKGLKTGIVSISIEDLYKQLTVGVEAEDDKLKSITVPTGGVKKQNPNEPMISMHDVRHRLNVSGFDYATTVKFDGIMRELIEDAKKK